MSHTNQIVVLTFATLTLACEAHWRLTVPMTRKGPGYENDPIMSNTGSTFVCRNAQPNPNLARPSYQAGNKIDIKFEGGGHVGDCSVYISYDVDRSLTTARFVKIANLPDCRSKINTLVPLVVPSGLPAGDAILRWDQYALHQGSFLEWYVQCADIKIVSSSNRKWDSFNSFSMVSPPVYPNGPSEGVGYRRNLAVLADADFFMTGPACVDDAINQCGMTAKGTRGYTGFGGEEGQASSPTTMPAPIPSPADPDPTSTITPDQMTCVPIGDCDAPWCSQPLYVEWCSSKSSEYCPSPFCKSIVPLLPTMAPMPTPFPVPAPGPSPAPAGRRCVPTSEGLYTDPVVWGPTCDAQGRANVCTAPICKWEAALVQVSASKHNFLGVALFQVDIPVLSSSSHPEF